MASGLVEHYLGRAQDFLQGMQLLRKEDLYPASSALLGIHSAVSFTDALRVGLGQEHLADDDHQAAVKFLRSLLPSKTARDENGIGTLTFLIGKKTAVAYGRKRLASTDYQTIFTRAERYARWINQVGRELQIEEWTHGE